jgi:apolipoprotein D and lipocalin family protein
MKTKITFFAIVILAAIILIFSFNMKAQKGTYKPVQNFQLERYLGTWYEIARFDHSFERGLSDVTALYEMRDDGKVRVINKGIKDGKESRAEGKAKMNGDPAAGHLKVSFFWIFYADYIILFLDEDYRFAVVTSSEKYLWFLCRSPHPDEQVIQKMKEVAIQNGFNIEKLIWVEHSKL